VIPYAVYQQAQARLTELRGQRVFDVDLQILQKNLYGVDLNDEAVDICRLSLWIKMARLGKVVTSAAASVFPSGENASAMLSQPSGFSNRRTSFPKAGSQSTTPFAPAVPRSLPSGEKRSR
jgi:hypothetical protein